MNRNFTKSPLFPITVIVGIFLFYQIAGSMTLVLAESLLGIWIEPYFAGFSHLAFLLIPILFISKMIHLKWKELFRININFDVSFLLICVLGLVGIQLFYSGYSVLQKMLLPASILPSYNYLQKLFEETYLKILGGTDAFAFSRALIIGAIIPAIVEEFVFRGFLLRSLEITLSPVKAIVVSGAVFGFIHLNPIDVVGLTLIGLYLGYITYQSGSIFPAIFIHFLNNSLAVVSLFLKFELINKPQEQPIGWSTALMLVVIGAIIIFLSAYLINKQKKVIF